MLVNLSNSDKKFVIDKRDSKRVLKYTWRLKKSRKNSFYIAASVMINDTNTTLYLHRFIINAPPGFDVHHKDEDRFNNRRNNLQLIESIEHRTYHNRKRAAEKKK